MGGRFGLQRLARRRRRRAASGRRGSSSESSRPRIRWQSVTVGSVPPSPKHAGPGDAPASCGPTLTAPSSSIQAIEPPPAPIETMSIIGADHGSSADLGLRRLEDRAALDQRDVVRRAADVRADDVLVAELARRARGSRSRRRPGRTRACGSAAPPRARAEMTPPFDCMSASGRWKPASCSRSSELAEVAGPERLDVCVQDGRRRALELAPLRRHLVRRGDRERG